MNEELIKKAMEIPSLDNYQNILFIGPHPDDIEIGAGGFSSKCIKNNKKVSYLICTNGGSGTLDLNVKSTDLAEIRKNEAIEAASIIGVNKENIYFLPFDDGGDYTVEEMTTEIAKIIIKIRPDLIVAPDPLMENETHPDHLKVGEAARRSLVIACYPNASRTRNIEVNELGPRNITLAFYYTDRCNSVVSISEENFMLQEKAIRAHKSQIDPSFEYILMYLKIRSNKFGLVNNTKYGEGYFVLSPLHQHCFMEKLY